jgi:hypothetical protein
VIIKVLGKLLIPTLVLLAFAAGASTARAGLSRTVASIEARAAIVHFWASREWTEDWSFSGCSRKGSGYICVGSVSGTVKVTEWFDPPPETSPGLRCSDYWGPNPASWPAHCDRTNGWYDSNHDGVGDATVTTDLPGSYLTRDATEACYLKVKVTERGFFPKTHVIPSCSVK